MARILEGYVVKFLYKGQPNKALFLEESRAENFAVQWHGTILPVYSELPVVQEVIEEARIISSPLCLENQTSQPLSSTSETDC